MTGIVVGVDGSDGAARALAWAVEECRLRESRVTAVMAWGWLSEYHDIVGDQFEPGYLEGIAADALAAYIDDALGPSSAETVDARTVNAGATRALLDASVGAALLVVGARGLGGFRGLLLGSVSQQCLHHASCPVAVVRDCGAADGSSPRVVVGVDGSESGMEALAWAAREAVLRQAKLDVVHAWQLPAIAIYPYPGSGFDPTLMEQAARATLDAAIAGLSADGMPPELNGMLVHGDAASAIVEAARDADLVVVGSRGLGQFSGLLLGAVGDRVTRHAPCPVVVVRSTGDAEDHGPSQ